MYRLHRILLLAYLMLAAWPVSAQVQTPGSPPASLHVFFCHSEIKRPPSAWEQWLRRKRPKKLFLPPLEFDYGMTQPLQTPSTPEDDPFESNLKIYNQGIYIFGISGARGYDLHNWPTGWAQLRQFLRLSNLLHIRNWLPQPESNALRMQNLVGGSFYFYF